MHNFKVGDDVFVVLYREKDIYGEFGGLTGRIRHIIDGDDGDGSDATIGVEFDDRSYAELPKRNIRATHDLKGNIEEKRGWYFFPYMLKLDEIVNPELVIAQTVLREQREKLDEIIQSFIESGVIGDDKK